MKHVDLPGYGVRRPYCEPHAVGRWVIVSQFMAHPFPSDFASREDAEAFIAELPSAVLAVRQITAAL